MDPTSQPQGPPQPPLATPVGHDPFYVPPRPSGRSLARWLWVLLAIGLLGSLLLNVVLFAAAGLASLASIDMDRTVQEKHHSHRQSSDNKVAVISLKGTIISGEGFIKRQIDRVADDKEVKAVVLRVDSPGGTITGSDFIYHRLREMAEERKIPVVVSMGGLAASGGYYVSMGCGESGVIFAEPTTWTGSIGVVIPHYDLSKLMEDVGVKQDSITSHPLKGMGSFTKPMTEQERAIFQELVDESFTQFKDIIKQGRPAFKQDPEALDKLATGQIYTAKQALKLGLVDEIGFLDDAVKKAIELAQLDEDDVSVVKYQREPNLTDLLIGSQIHDRQGDLATLLEMTAPRAYYLCTWLPPLAGSAKPIE